jgi:hypothetical protein
MLEKIISGEQTGADQAGGRSAEACGLATDGWMTRGFLTLARSRALGLHLLEPRIEMGRDSIREA